MKGLLCIDFINDIMDDAGKLAGKGYHRFARRHNVVAIAAEAQQAFRLVGLPVIHVRIGFDSGYVSQPKSSPLFGRAHEFSALQRDTWGTEFISDLAPANSELSLYKPRVGAFFGTPLETYLRLLSVTEVVVTGVATDLAVSTAVREAHDRDFRVTVIPTACAAADETDHDHALLSIQKLAAFSMVNELDLPKR